MKTYRNSYSIVGLLVALALLASLVPAGMDMARAATPKDTATNVTIGSGAGVVGGAAITTPITVNGYAQGSGAQNGQGLGAYDLKINFDRTKLQVASVSGSSTAGSPFGSPTNNLATANSTTGQLSLNAFHTSIPGPTGPTIEIARVSWTIVAGPGPQTLALTITTVADTAGANVTAAGSELPPTAVNGSISIFVPPVASFTKSYNPTNGAAPNNVTFTDTSTGPPDTWSWTFGDGTGSSLQSPSKTYNTAGNYTVSLIVNNIVGPASSTSQTVSIYTTPVPGFSKTLSPTTGAVPNTVNFTDSSTGNITGWSWNFGDGTGSSSQNPSKLYSNPGNYTVTLTASNPVGSNSTSQTVSTYATPAASFTKTVSPSTGVAPVTVNVTDTSTGNITSRLWNFGDGTTATAASTTKIYSVAGNYTITLTATNPLGSNTSAGQVVNVYTIPAVGFNYSPNAGIAPLAVNFTDTSSGNVTTWSWNFGDGASSTAQNPSHTFNTAGNYMVSFTASNPAGSNVANQVVSVYSMPVASFTKSPASGIAPLTVNFTDTSTGNIQTRSWNFGDGTSSSSANPTKTYTSAGNFTVTLTATNMAGSNTSAGQTVSVYSSPTANFSATPVSTNPGANISFTDSSTGNIVSWSWNFGDGTSSTLQNPTKSYSADATYNVSLTVTNPAGTNTLTKTAYITIISYQAELDNIDNKIDTSNYAYLGASIKRFFNPVTQETVTLDGIGAYDAYMSYTTDVSMKNKWGNSSFPSPTVGYNIQGGTKTTVNSFQTGSTPQPPIELFRLYPWLTGSRTVPVTVTLHFNTITRTGGGEIPQAGDKTKTFVRGDANSNGLVNITDALFIAQYLAGLRGLGETSTTVNPVNSATPRNDSATLGSQITIQDALFIAQMLASLRNDSYIML